MIAADRAQYEAVQRDARASRERRAAQQHERSLAAAARDLAQQPRSVECNNLLHLPELEQLMAEIVAGFRREIVAELVEPLQARIAELEARPVLSYAGVWREGEAYALGALCTHAGALWLRVEQDDDSAKPGNGKTGWRLVDKHALDGPRFATAARSRSSNGS